MVTSRVTLMLTPYTVPLIATPITPDGNVLNPCDSPNP